LPACSPPKVRLSPAPPQAFFFSFTQVSFPLHPKFNFPRVQSWTPVPPPPRRKTPHLQSIWSIFFPSGSSPFFASDFSPGGDGRLAFLSPDDPNLQQVLLSSSFDFDFWALYDWHPTDPSPGLNDPHVVFFLLPPSFLSTTYPPPFRPSGFFHQPSFFLRALWPPWNIDLTSFSSGRFSPPLFDSR